MPGRITSLFEPDHRRRGNGILTLIISDYLACYRPRAESPRKLALLFVPRMLGNPELHATAILRIALNGPRILMSFWRTVLIAKHSIETQGGVDIGHGLRLPHPVGIVFGRGLVIGNDVTLFQHVTLAARPSVEHLRRARSEMPDAINEIAPGDPVPPRPCPTIEDDVIVLSGSYVLGPITVGKGALVAAESWLDHDLAPGAVYRGRTQS